MSIFNNRNPEFKTDASWVQQVIISTIKRIGDGTENSPVRIVTQIFTMHGELICEIDHWKEEQNK